MYQTVFLVSALCLAVSAIPVHADIIVTGSVVPVDPATATAGDDVYAGATAAGTITVTPSSTLLASELFVGDGGAGSVTFQGTGASGNVGYFYSGYSADGAITVADGASLNVIEEAYVGYDAPGTVTISGGSVTSNHTYVGYDGDGSVDIRNTGSVWNVAGEFYSGYDGAEDAFWTISNGGRLNATNAGEAFGITYDADSTYQFGIGNDGAGRIDVAGDVTRGGGDLYFALDATAPLTVGDMFTLIDYGTWSAGQFLVSNGGGGFMTLADGDTYVSGGNSFLIDYDTDLGGGDLALTATLTSTAVPEPSSFALLGLGGIGFLIRRRKIVDSRRAHPLQR